MDSKQTFHLPNRRKLIRYERPTVRALGAWVISILLAFVFLGAGIAKLRGEAAMMELFASFGYPVWFMYVTGVLEVAGAMLLLVPPLSGIGTVLLVGIMLGALLSKVIYGQTDTAFVPLALVGLLVMLGFLRRWSPLRFLTERRDVTASRL